MKAELETRLARPSERDAVLAFIVEMGFNARDANTWRSLSMTAMTAWERDRLIGVIPLEPRKLRVAPGHTVSAVHETAVAVHPDYRGQGVGSRLHEAMLIARPFGAQVATVYREQPSSGAYRWYARSGFARAMHIVSWIWDTPAAPIAGARGVESPAHAAQWTAVRDMFRAGTELERHGFVDRNERSVQEWLGVHPYRRVYDFRVLSLPASTGYALYGLGYLHSDVLRMDVLEWSAPSDAHKLVEAVLTRAAELRCGAVRWAVAEDDEHAAVLQAQGATPGWNFDMMIRILDPEYALPDAAFSRCRYFSLDYI